MVGFVYLGVLALIIQTSHAKGTACGAFLVDGSRDKIGFWLLKYYCPACMPVGWM
jgi:hypothetical protein